MEIYNMKRKPIIIFSVVPLF